MQVSEEEFQLLMEQTMESIPEVFKKRMDNIVFLVEPFPSDSDLSRLGMKDGRNLLGLYSGIPYSQRSTWYTGAMPDRIILFQQNIEAVCKTKEQLINKIKEVVIHEIAHYFGMDEKQIRDAGY
ncbi:MAG: metallopeptidase family protein [Ignavibacteriae bacterium]|nr:MAG: metallopeptidase family protein [Ignavibacteriota bacterium]